MYYACQVWDLTQFSGQRLSDWDAAAEVVPQVALWRGHKGVVTSVDCVDGRENGAWYEPYGHYWMADLCLWLVGWLGAEAHRDQCAPHVVLAGSTTWTACGWIVACQMGVEMAALTCCLQHMLTHCPSKTCHQNLLRTKAFQLRPSSPSPRPPIIYPPISFGLTPPANQATTHLHPTNSTATCCTHRPVCGVLLPGQDHFPVVHQWRAGWPVRGQPVAVGHTTQLALTRGAHAAAVYSYVSASVSVYVVVAVNISKQAVSRLYSACHPPVTSPPKQAQGPAPGCVQWRGKRHRCSALKTMYCTEPWPHHASKA